MPRRQRRQRGALRGIAATVAIIAIIAGAGWFFRDAVRGLVAPPEPSPTAPAPIAVAGTPAAVGETGGLANALATVTPTPASATATPRAEEPSLPARSTAPAGAEATASGSDISTQTMPLLDLLPTQDQLPPGLVLADEAERSKSEVVDSLGGTEEASQLLDDWGWSGNAYRDYIGDESNPSPNGTTFLNVSVHRFADPESAGKAMVFFSDQVIFGQGLQEVEPPAIGQSARLLVGSPEGAPLSVLYVQQGPIMYRIGGSSASADSDPTPDVLAVASAIISGQTNGG
jgi:hypothetical protein